jgi:Flp pilus assembly protein TadD/DNA-binding MarR family transcriptional regulator
LIALSFPEELYQIKTLADFWWAACDALADELDVLELSDEAAMLDAAVASAKSASRNSDGLADAGLKTLQQTCAKLRRRPVLLVDNLDMVFQRIDKTGRKLNDPQAPAYWALREALSTRTSPVVIGGSVRLSESFTSYDAAFYDFFLPKRLGKLSLDEVQHVLERLADAQALPEVKQRLHARPSRVETLFELTGGNPRALGLIFELLRSGPNSRAVEDFERLMDLTTPYYKARIEDLSEQAQVIMHALAVRDPNDGLRFGHTASQLGSFAGLPTGTISAQLTILENEGLVEKSTAHGKAQYRIAEQLFRLWLQMRGTRRIRQNVILLTKFFEAMYDLEELSEELRDNCGASALAEAKFVFAVAGTGDASLMRSELEAYGTDRLRKHLSEHGGNFNDYLPTADAPELATTGDTADTARTTARVALLEKAVDAMANGAIAEADAAYREAIELDPEVSSLWTGWGKVLAHDPARHDEAETAFRKAAELDEADALPWLELGKLLDDKPERHPTAEMALQKATELASTNPQAWDALGNFLITRCSRYEEAEQAFRKSTAFLPNMAGPWRNLAAAQILQKRFLESEISLREAINVEPSDAKTWNILGIILKVLGRIAEAEQAFRRAIELDPDFADPLGNLGEILVLSGERYKEAESAYRSAIQLAPKDARTWFNLGKLLEQHLERPVEAKGAYKMAAQLDDTKAHALIRLGALLMMTDDDAEAEDNLRTAIRIAPEDAQAWTLLGVLLTGIEDRTAEAEAALRKALEIAPDSSEAWFALGAMYFCVGRNEEASVALDRMGEQNQDVAAPIKPLVTRMRTWITLARVRQTFERHDHEALGDALSRLLAQSDDPAALLVSEEFVENFLSAALAHPESASTLLYEMRNLGFERHARPLLLAFEAALEGRADMIDELEPELQGATQRMFERLQAGLETKRGTLQAAS